jgi:hypothetical protein
MNKKHPLRMLIVDDVMNKRTDAQQSLREEIESAFREHKERGEIELDFADTVGLANRKVKDSFYHAVIVDHDLGRGYGAEVLQKVRDQRPSCLRILITRHPETDVEGAEHLYRSLLPPEPLAHLFVTQTICSYTEVVDRLLNCMPPDRLTLCEVGEKAADRSAIDSDDHPLVRTIIDKINAKNSRPSWAEIIHVLDQLFAPDTFKQTRLVRDLALRQPAPAEIAELELKPLAGGRSSSTVLRCVPHTHGGGHKGSLCVVKIGPRSEMREESDRYHLYVRFYRSSVRRVEMLSSQLGDTVGAVCYSFAGGGVSDIKPLEDLLKDEDLRTVAYLRHEFSPESREWYRQVQAADNPAALVKFFETTHKIKIAEQLGDVVRLAKDADVPIRLRHVPEIAAELRQVASHTCIIHGDLNAGNLLLDFDPQDAPIPFQRRDENRFWTSFETPVGTGHSRRSLLIDYRHTTRGPIFIDFAALQASLRMLPAEVDGFADYAKAVEQEREVWRQGWSGAPMQYGRTEELEGLPYWGLVSHELIRLGRLNFEATQTEPGRRPVTDAAWPREYAATCLLYGLRLFKIQALGTDIVPDPTTATRFKDLRKETRLRFACWILTLCDVVCPS